MNESANLPINFGGIDVLSYSAFDFSEVLILPVSYQKMISNRTDTSTGATAIIDASRNLELYEEETDAEVYKIGIHTLDEFKARETPKKMMDELYEHSKELLKDGKFLCTLGGEHSISVPIIRAHVEKFYNLSVLQIDAHADLRDEYDGTPHSHASVMARVVKDLNIPAVQVGIRSISDDEARVIDAGLPTKIFWAKDIVGKTNWIDEVVASLTDNVYLTIDVKGFDPSIIPTNGTPEPGGLGWYETLKLLRKLAKNRRVVGMDLVEYTYLENQNASAFLCAKLVYKSLAYIFNHETPKISSRN